MPGWGVIPTIRTSDVPRAFEFYTKVLGFGVRRGGPDDDNVSLQRGDATVMIERATSFYSETYNLAIRERMGTPSANTLYIEAEDLEDLHAQVAANEAVIVDPLADRPWGQAEFTVADPDGNWLTFWKSPHTTSPETTQNVT